MIGGLPPDPDRCSQEPVPKRATGQTARRRPHGVTGLVEVVRRPGGSDGWPSHYTLNGFLQQPPGGRAFNGRDVRRACRHMTSAGGSRPAVAPRTAVRKAVIPTNPPGRNRTPSSGSKNRLARPSTTRPRPRPPRTGTSRFGSLVSWPSPSYGVGEGVDEVARSRVAVVVGVEVGLGEVSWFRSRPRVTAVYALSMVNVSSPSTRSWSQVVPCAATRVRGQGAGQGKGDARRPWVDRTRFVSAPRRSVRVTDQFFHALDDQLGPDRSVACAPSATDFLVCELPPVVERFATDFDGLPEVVEGSAGASTSAVSRSRRSP